jgi:hypothetical protein
MEILTESSVEEGFRHGFSRNYLRVSLPADACRPNALVRAEIVAADEQACPGRVENGREG